MANVALRLAVVATNGCLQTFGPAQCVVDDYSSYVPDAADDLCIHAFFTVSCFIDRAFGYLRETV